MLIKIIVITRYYPLNTMLELPPSPPPPNEDTSSDEMVGDSDGESVGGSISDASEQVIKVNICNSSMLIISFIYKKIRFLKSETR